MEVCALPVEHRTQTPTSDNRIPSKCGRRPRVPTRSGQNERVQVVLFERVIDASVPTQTVILGECGIVGRVVPVRSVTFVEAGSEKKT